MIRQEFLKFAFKYGARSLIRNRKRSILMVFTVVLAVVVSIVGHSYAKAIFKYWVQSTIESGPGQAQVHKKGFWTEDKGVTRELSMKAGASIEDVLNKDQEIEAYSTRLEVDGLISAGDKAIYFLGSGIDAKAEEIVSPRLLSYKGNQGKFIDATNKSGIAIGFGLAETLSVKVGDSLSLTVNTVNGNLNALDVNLIGVINVPDSRISKRLVYMNLSLAQEIMEMEGWYNEIALRLKPGVSLLRWQWDMKRKLKEVDAELRPWWEVFPPMKKVEEIWRSVVGVISGLLFISTAISVLTIILLSVGERTIEIGILMSLGAKAKDIRKVFAVEALIVGLFGAFVGVCVGNGIVLTLRIIGFPLLNPFFPGYVLIYPTLDIGMTAVVTVAALLICYFSAIIPARRASQVEPVVAFRGQV